MTKKQHEDKQRGVGEKDQQLGEQQQEEEECKDQEVEQPLFLLHLIPSTSPHRSSSDDDDDDVDQVLLLPSNYKKRLTDLASRGLLKVQLNYDGGGSGRGGGTAMNTTTTSMTIPKVIHLHEDIWFSQRRQKRPIVESRLRMQMGLVKTRLYARKTVCRRIDATTARSFLQRNHLWDYVKSKYHYGLFIVVVSKDKDNNGGDENNDEEDRLLLVAVASFSHRRKVTRRGGAAPSSSSNNPYYNSFELLRYCCLLDHNVVGGISKLLKTFVKERKQQLLQIEAEQQQRRQQQRQQQKNDDEKAVMPVVKIDIVTVIDRDWGGGENWHTVGFETVQVLPPLCMVIGPSGLGPSSLSLSSSSASITGRHTQAQQQQRYHVVGAGIEHQHNQQQQRQNDKHEFITTGNSNSLKGNTTSSSVQDGGVVSSTAGRLGLPTDIWTELDRIGNISTSTSNDIVQYLTNHSYYPIYDSGVERLIKIVVDDGNQKKEATKKQHQKDEPPSSTSSSSSSTAKELWKQSTPTFAASYSSTNSGIQLLLKDAEQGLPPMDSDLELKSKESWRSSSSYNTTTTTTTNQSSNHVVFSTPSSFDPLSTNVEVIERRRGWRTVGTSTIDGGVSSTKKKKPRRSIYHGFYKADDDSGSMPDPHAYVSEYIKTMAVVALALSPQQPPPVQQPSPPTVVKKQQPPRGILYFGLGAGTLVRFLAYHGSRNFSRHLAIELDGGVVKASNGIKTFVTTTQIFCWE